nr:hypothetical protein [Mesorhizobium sp. AA23]
MPTTLTILLQPQTPAGKIKAALHLIPTGRSPEWRGKSPPARTVPYGRVSAKVSEEKRFWRKKFTRHGCHALAALHNCNKSPIFSACGGQTRGWNMGFFTEMFARPRPQEQQRYRSALALLNAMSNADRADIGIKPADFPRIAREMSIR